MTKTYTSTRRELLILGAKVGVGGGLFLVLGGCSPDEPSFSINISRVFRQPSHFVQIGRDYAQKFPENVSAKVLERNVFVCLPEQDSLEEEVNLRLTQLIREDFAKDRVFLFENWILSHTEGQLSALALEA